MTDFAKLELELMACARGAIEPVPQDRARLRKALAVRIATAGAAAGASSLAIDAKPWRHLVNSHLVGLSSVAAFTGALAFGAGYIAGHHTRTVVVKTVTVVQAQPPAASVVPIPAPPEPLTPASLSSSLDLDHSGARPRAATIPAPSASARDHSLSDELELLRRAERTIRSGNSQVALGLLAELDENFPKGQLLQERTAARVMARCQLDTEDEARAHGSAYLLAHAQSVYADRVRTLCHLNSTQAAKDPPQPGD